MSKKTNDPYEPDMGAVNDMGRSGEFSTAGEFCPKMNKSIGKSCRVCNYVQQIFMKKYPDGHPAKEFARQKMAKSSWYLNFVTEDDPDTPRTMRIGTQLGSDLIDGIKTHGWTGIINPKAEKGREMKIVKSTNEHGRNKYSISPSLETADWDVPDEVIDNLPNLDQKALMEMIVDNSDEIIDVTNLEKNKPFAIRICSPWTTGENGSDNKWFMNIIWRHWGVTEEQISGEEPINWKDEKEADDEGDGLPWDDDNAPVVPDEDEKPKSKPKSKKSSSKEEQKSEKPKKKKKPACFGKSQFFDVDDETCKNCDYFDECKKTVKAAMAEGEE